MRSISSVLVANRGEIAVSDANAPHVNCADEAFHIGSNVLSDSYLNADKILFAAQTMKVDAIHPGYGFLSENAEFSQKVAECGIIFIGPKPSSILAIGDKISSKVLLAKKAPSVPLVPGYSGDDQSVERLAKEASRIGFPVLIKASAGGGGKGMRVVRDEKHLAEEIKAAQGEAKRSFGDARLLIEKYIESSKHIEVQIFGDSHGNFIHCFERECSVQRRHQKIIEETPSSFLSPALKEDIMKAAVTVASVIDYENAGTVEFILDTKTGKFYFLEVNTRLQVEHPVTEMTTGLDLVRLQIEVASGKELPKILKGKVTQQGYSIECRVCAEDPDNDFAPCIGTIEKLTMNPLPGVRFDTGISQSSTITVHFDSLLAKVIAHAPTRPACIALMQRALSTMVLMGIKTNISFLIHVLEEEKFRSGMYDTSLLNEVIPRWKPVVPGGDEVGLVALVFGWARRFDSRGFFGVKPGFRNLPYRPLEVKLEYAGKEVVVRYELDMVAYNKFGIKSTFKAWVNGGNLVSVLLHDCEIVDDGQGRRSGRIALNIDGVLKPYSIVDIDSTPLAPHLISTLHIYTPSWQGHVSIASVRDRLYSLSGDQALGDRTLITPMPCKVLSIIAPTGTKVSVGDAVLTVESMKMETKVKAKVAGVVEVKVKEGDVVQAGVVVAVISS
ncbi:hypothetical protein HDU97_007757 [Phlyctochytrium planicorne]|nr:hypothetical protein HDU97_007757 [Phlyctochytrium planicorne]